MPVCVETYFFTSRTVEVEASKKEEGGRTTLTVPLKDFTVSCGQGGVRGG